MNRGSIIKPELILRIDYGAEDNRLKIFICHAKEDKLIAREIYKILKNGNFNPWLDEEKLIPGVEWNEIISEQIITSDVILICLSSNSVSKIGYLQKEIRQSLEMAELQPEGKIFIMPIKLNECQIPRKLLKFQYLDYFTPGAKERLINTLSYIQSNTDNVGSSLSDNVTEIDLFLGFIEDLNIVIEKSVFLNVILVAVNAESGPGEDYAYRDFLNNVYPYVSEAALENHIYIAFTNRRKNVFSLSLIGHQLKQKFNFSSKGVYSIFNGELVDFKKPGFIDDSEEMLENIAEIKIHKRNQ
jgi:hypothetical protein